MPDVSISRPQIHCYYYFRRNLEKYNCKTKKKYYNSQNLIGHMLFGLATGKVIEGGIGFWATELK